MGDDNYKLSKLNDTNYPSWSTQFRSLLEVKDLDDALPPRGTPLPDVKAEPSAPCKSDKKALAHMRLWVDTSHLPVIEACVTARDAWFALQRLYQQHSAAQRHFHSTQLMHARLQPGESISQYISRLQGHYDALVLTGDTVVTPQHAAERALVGLPAQYQVIAKLLRTRTATGELSLASIRPDLLQEEQELAADQAAGGQQAALFAGKQQQRGGNGSGRPGRGAGNGARGGGRAQGDNKKGGKQRGNGQRCDYCGKPNHHESECKTKKKDLAGGGGQGNTSSGGGGQQKAAIALTAYGSNNSTGPSLLAARLPAPASGSHGSGTYGSSYSSSRYSLAQPTCRPASHYGLGSRMMAHYRPAGVHQHRSNRRCATRVSAGSNSHAGSDGGLPNLSALLAAYHSSSGNSSGSSSSSGVASGVPTQPALHALGTSAPAPTQFVVDSGATGHFVANPALLHHAAPATMDVTYGNDATLSAATAGNIFIPACATGGGRLAMPAHYIPGSGHNLLSVGAATSAGQVVVFDGAAARFYDASAVQIAGTPIAIAPKDANGLYTLPGALPAQPGSSAALAARAVDAAQCWHRRFCHAGHSTLARTLRLGAVTGVPTPPSAFETAGGGFCKPCAQGKQHQAPFPSSATATSAPLELLHMDVMGPVSPASSGGSSYVVTFLDDYTGLAAISPLRFKSGVTDAVTSIIPQLEARCGFKVKTIRSDNGGEFVNTALRGWLQAKGIAHQTSCPYTPQQNGAAERLNRTLMERVRAMLADSGAPHHLWTEALATVVYTRNRLLSARQTKTPWELFTGTKPNVSHLRVFGCAAQVLTPKARRTSKLHPVGESGILVGYPLGTKGYKVYIPARKTIVISRNVVFDETPSGASSASTPAAPLAGSLVYHHPHPSPAPLLGGDHVSPPGPSPASSRTPLLGGDYASPPGPSSSTPLGSPPGYDDTPAAPARPRAARFPMAAAAPGADGSASGEPPSFSSGEQRDSSGDATAAQRYQRLRQAANADGFFKSTLQPRPLAAPSLSPSPLNPPNGSSGGTLPGNASGASSGAVLLATDDTPATMAEALASPHTEDWRQAMEEELRSHAEHGTWSEDKPPPGTKLMRLKWVFATKRGAHGIIERRKARLVAVGAVQREGVDYDESFAPVSKYSSLRAFLSLVASADLHLHQLDIKTAFLNGELEEDVWACHPPGFPGTPGTALHLRRALYGLRQAPRAWYLRLVQELESMGFTRSSVDPSIFYADTPAGRVILLVYVDDIAVASSSLAAIANVKSSLLKAFPGRDLGEASYFLGITIKRNRAARTLTIAQPTAVKDLLDKFNMSAADAIKTKSTPLSPSAHMTPDGAPLDPSVPYASLIGGLNYLACCTRPDISHAVGACARYMAAPTQQHWTYAKGILRYLAATPALGITFGTGSGLQGYSDADFASDIATRRSTTAYVFLYNGGAISWQSRRQATVAASTSEAEYMAAAAATKEALYLRVLISELEGSPTATISIKVDNNSALSLLKNPLSAQRCKHIDVIYHFARERAARGEVCFSFCPTDQMVADALTKAVPAPKLAFCRSSMGLS